MSWNMIGAAFAAAAPGVPSWSTGFQDGNNMGGLIAAALAPAGGFGKFVLVVLAVSTSSSCAPNLYSFGEYIHRFFLTILLFKVVLSLLSYFPFYFR